MFIKQILVLTASALIAAFLCGGVQAGVSVPSSPRPYEGAINVNPHGLTLSWSAVADAASYSVYLGEDPNQPRLLGTVVPPSLMPDTVLNLGKRCHWRVDTNTAGGTVIPGPWWQFTVIPPRPSDPDLLAWYGFDELRGNSSVDLAGNEAGMEMTRVIWDTAGAPGFGGCVRSEGAGHVLFGIPGTDTPRREMTLTGWFRLDRQDEPAALWCLGNDPTDCVSLVPQPAGGGGPLIEVRAVGQSRPITTQIKDPLPLDRWTHLAMAMDGADGQITAYADGALILTARGWTHLGDVLGQAGIVSVATSLTSEACLPCAMDDLRLYARALDAQQIARTMLAHPISAFEPEPRHGAQRHTTVPAVLRWGLSSGDGTYNVYAGTNPDHLELVAENLTNAEHALQQTLVNGQTLYWEVEAIVGQGFFRGPRWLFSATSLSLNNVIVDGQPWWPDYERYYHQVAPDMSVTDLDGRGHRLRDYRGRHLLVVVWAPWCSACRQDMTILSQLRAETGEDELALLTVTDESNRSLMSGFLAAHPEINFPVCVTRLSALPAPFGTPIHLPSTFYIAPDGTMKLGTIGDVPLNTMKQILDAAWPYRP